MRFGVRLSRGVSIGALSAAVLIASPGSLMLAAQRREWLRRRPPRRSRPRRRRLRRRRKLSHGRAPIPAARTVIDRHIRRSAAEGDPRARVDARCRNGHRQRQRDVGDFEIFAAKPDRALSKVTLGGIGDLIEGYDGTHAWSSSPMMGPMLSQGKELEQRKLRRRFLRRAARPNALHLDHDRREDDVPGAAVLQDQPRPEGRRRGLRLLRRRDRASRRARSRPANRRWAP